MPKTDQMIRRGIKMHKQTGSWFFGQTNEHKTVYDLEEAIKLNQNGWYFDQYDQVFHNLALGLWRDLKGKK